MPNLEGMLLKNTRVKDLTPLKGLKIEVLDISNTPVEDISFLRALPPIGDGNNMFRVMEVLDLSRAKIKDFSPLKGMLFQELGLFGYKLDDWTFLSSIESDSFYLNDTNIKSLKPLEGKKIHGVSIDNTQVSKIPKFDW